MPSAQDKARDEAEPQFQMQTQTDIFPGPISHEQKVAMCDSITDLLGLFSVDRRF